MTATASRLRLSAREHARLARRARARRAAVAYAFLAPNLILLTAFMLVPIAWLVPESFSTGGILGPRRWVGLENWKAVFHDEIVVRSLLNTLKFVAIAVPSVFVLAMGLALLLRPMRRGAAAARAFIYVPTLAPMTLLALTWVFVVNPDFGVLNIALRQIGVSPVNWLGDTRFSMIAIAMLEVWRGLGFWALFFLAALVGLSRDPLDAAELDGASAWQRLRLITLPMMRPTLVFAVVIGVVLNLQVFDSVFILTDGGPVGSTQTAVWYIYKSIFQYNQPGYGAALSLVLVVVIFVLTAVVVRVVFRSGRAGRSA